MLDRSSPADPLSDFLGLLKPRSISCGAIDAGKGHVSFPAHEGVKCHALVVGEAWLCIHGQAEPIQLTAGDFVILPHGRGYSLASDLCLPPEDYHHAFIGLVPGHLFRYAGGGLSTVISAAFNVDRYNSEMLLKVLPSVVHLRAHSVSPTLLHSMQLMLQELAAPQPGGRLIIQQLATLLLAQSLRAYLAHGGKHQVSWLFALADRQIGRSIGLMHADPALHWTVQELAKMVNMGRTSFSNRFKKVVGFSPMDYLTRLRMMLARDRLATSNDAIALIAESVGYESEFAFSKAFKRYSGYSPRRYSLTHGFQSDK